ncbi:unnamed protein product [Peronospora belbahrii]|uniref:Ubiquitin-like domain-containing protein n=1 Tax=Peronospora belbahrii TaxID=622444 RepID=A0AAU9LEB6_9STRA|nr:unnamed protein product [Peronospora belbahrii]CAH0521681.1 unnamed protein product [Peronospora belbahrii]
MATLSMSVIDFRAAVAQATAIAIPRQRLIYRGKLLKDGALLAAYDVQDGHTVHLVTKPATRDEENTDRRPADGLADGPAWNLANLRSALRRTGVSTTSGHQLPMLREILAETAVENTRNEEEFVVVDLEPLTQGIFTIQSVLSTAQREQPRQFFIGQWLDVKDTVNQWLEATIMDIANGKMLVHYHGWPTRWDEWIELDSDRIAAFRTRTLHIPNAQRMSPVPTTRVPNAPRVSGRDIRRTVIQVRNLMREMMPHIEQLADLCEEDLRQQQPEQREEIARNETMENATDSSMMPEDRQSRESEVSEAAHLVAPLFDRFGRLLMDSAQYLDPLLYPEMRASSQRQQERRLAALRRGHGGSSRQHTASSSTSIEVQDSSLSIRDLIISSPNVASESNQPRRSIDVHIHAIVAPASLSSLASLSRGNVAGSHTEASPQTPSTPPIGRSFGFNDTRVYNSHASDDEGDHSRVPLLGSYRHRAHSHTSDSSHHHQQQRAVSRDLDDFLSDDFFRTSFGRNDDDSDDESSISYMHSDAMQSSRSAYRPPSLSERMSSPGTPSDDGSAQYSSGTIGVISEVAATEEQLQARVSEAINQGHSDGNGRASLASTGSSSPDSSSGFPTFLEVMRRTLSSVRSFVHTEQSSSSVEDTRNSLELVSGSFVPSSSPLPSSPSSLSTPPVSPVSHSSIENVTSYHRGLSESSIDGALDLDEVD